LRSEFDLTYVTMDSVSEGVGASQILPLVIRMAQDGLHVNLISYEKHNPPTQLIDTFESSKVLWTQLNFGSKGVVPGFSRMLRLSKSIPKSRVIHARSDLPVLAANLAGNTNVLWDIRSLWGEQRRFMETNFAKQKLYSLYPQIENAASRGSKGISTLTSAVVPVLESRHPHLPTIRTVNPTSVDLVRFKFIKQMPHKLLGLFSGTYNAYYDLDLSRRFLDSLRALAEVDICWAKPIESTTHSLDCGEDRVFSLTQEEMPSILSLASFGISICKENAGVSLKAAMPTKIAEFLSTGRPVVVNAGLGDFDELLSEFQAGIILRGEDNLSQKAAELITLCQDPMTPFRCRELAEKHFNFEDVVKNYQAVYEQIAKD